MKNKIWKGSFAQCIGPLHVRQNFLMQDSCRLKFFSDGFVATVSDGLGSCVHADFGSNSACKCFVRCARRWAKRGAFSPEKLIQIFHSLWIKKIEKAGFDVKDCAATFLAAVGVKNQIFLFRLGDGMIVALCDDRTKNMLLSDFKNESFSNLTCSLKREFRISDWEILKVNAENVRCLFLCTDGLSDDLKQNVSFDFVLELANQYESFGENKIKSDMDRWISAWPVPRHTDDKTAVFIQRR